MALRGHCGFMVYHEEGPPGRLSHQTQNPAVCSLFTGLVTQAGECRIGSPGSFGSSNVGIGGSLVFFCCLLWWLKPLLGPGYVGCCSRHIKTFGLKTPRRKYSQTPGSRTWVLGVGVLRYVQMWYQMWAFKPWGSCSQGPLPGV